MSWIKKLTNDELQGLVDWGKSELYKTIEKVVRYHFEDNIEHLLKQKQDIANEAIIGYINICRGNYQEGEDLLKLPSRAAKELEIRSKIVVMK